MHIILVISNLNTEILRYKGVQDKKNEMHKQWLVLWTQFEISMIFGISIIEITELYCNYSTKLDQPTISELTKP